MFVDRERAEQVLRAQECWFSVDAVPRDLPTSTFKRLARLRQALWRQANGWPVGSEPVRATKRRPQPTPVGSRIDLDFATRHGVNFLTPTIGAQAEHRLANSEPHQMLSARRLKADLLSSQPMSFNLFGELAADLDLATAALSDWLPGGIDQVVGIRFEHSPGRLDPEYLGNRTAFDVFVEGRRGAERVFLGIETKYHEHPRLEPAPDPTSRPRYWEVTERSHAFRSDWEARIVGTPLQQIWLDHLLALSMLQSATAGWADGAFVLVAPDANPAWVPLAERYSDVLEVPGTFATRTVESVIDAVANHANEAWCNTFQARYLDLSEAITAVGGTA